MTSQEIRQSFVDFFVAKGHKHVAGATLVPDTMATTLFTIAGMEPFVPAFLGEEAPPAPRVVTVQRCLRVAGGKNDIESVGRTGRHATLLEMLGNFSFGDYYKREAIAWAWEYLTQTLRVPTDRLFATVYVDDDEAADIWSNEVGLPAERISRFREDNFWDMGPTGPCGPCSEIFYDLGASTGCGKPTCKVGCADCNRYIEIWNLVFQQYDRDSAGKLHPLPKKCIDTGMGLERLCMMLTGKTSIFDADLYQDIIAALPAPERGASSLPEEEMNVHKRIIADHARAATFLVADGVMPSNTDRGYVLRFLARRAIRSGRLLGLREGFFSALAPVVIRTLVAGYAELRGADERVVNALEAEERQFERTLARGSARLSGVLEDLARTGQRTLDGSTVFELHDTFGFPPELTAEIAREAQVRVDMAGYRKAMDEQRTRARDDARAKRAEVRVGAPATNGAQGTDGAPATEFVGYEDTAAKGRVIALFDDRGKRVEALERGRPGLVVLDRTPFYAERGGQIGDRGVLARDGVAFEVTDTYYQDKTYRTIVHAGIMRNGVVALGDALDALVDPQWRREIQRHHTATHLLQRALKDVAGEAVAQRGSAVFPERTRFDFDSPVGALTREQKSQVTSRVNELIREDHHVSIDVMPFREAVARGAIYMANENYGDVVRVVQFGPSIELCGGTHVGSTGEIGHFVLLSESAISAGTRRVEGLASQAADDYVARMRESLEHVGSVLVTGVEGVPEMVDRLARERRELEKKIATLQGELATTKVDEYLAGIKKVDDIPYLTVRADADDPSAVRELAKSIAAKLPSGVLVVAAAGDAKVSLLVTASDDVVRRGISAKNLLSAIAAYVDGKGGGTATSAQGGGKNPKGVEAALAHVPEAIRAALTR